MFDRKGKPVPLKAEMPPAKETAAHHQADFIDAVRTGRRPNAEIAMGHVSVTLCHLGNIATRVGRTLRFDPAAEQIVGDDEAASLTRRSYREGHWATPKGV